MNKWLFLPSVLVSWTFFWLAMIFLTLGGFITWLLFAISSASYIPKRPLAVSGFWSRPPNLDDFSR